MSTAACPVGALDRFAALPIGCQADPGEFGGGTGQDTTDGENRESDGRLPGIDRQQCGQCA
jgi:hypothetical protein